jgi:formylglycine-generating enzyme required for sulfatase activity
MGAGAGGAGGAKPALAGLSSFGQTFAAALSPIARDRTDGSLRDSGDDPQAPPPGVVNPRVFISYSHDSAAHRDWVRLLAEQLRANGVDVQLDQWDLRPGADVVRFMERGIVEADRVLMVCTANYVAKAEERKGGAGYEGIIVTGQVVRATQTIKFVPIVRDNPSEALIPAFLGQRLWLDFRDDHLFNERLQDLLHDLHEVPRYVKPPLGPSPFAAPPLAPESGPASGSVPAPPSSTPPFAIPSFIPVEITTSQLRREGSQWRVERRGLTVKSFAEELGKGESLRLIAIPAGRFLMGSPSKEVERSSVEGPQHEVSLASFFLSQTPITQAQWRAVAGWQAKEGERWGLELNPNPSWFQSQEGKGKGSFLEGETSTNKRPVERVSWEEAMEFCARLSQRTGRRYRLPSEAQWEYACRAGTTTPFHFGETITSKLANYDASFTYANGPKGDYRKQTSPVGMFPANDWGLQDMHGNVWEWCLDHWHGSYEGAPSDGSAWVDGEGLKGEESREKLRLLRGGSWFDRPQNCRSAYRSRNHPGARDHYGGFRVCCLPQD